jgi:cytochrome c-type biogenesis protein CcmH
MRTLQQLRAQARQAFRTASFLPPMAALASLLVMGFWMQDWPYAQDAQGAQQDTGQGTPAAAPHDAQHLAQQLAQRLSGPASEQTDPQPWALLGRTRAVTGDWAGAAAAFAQATQHAAQDASLWAERARAVMALARQQQQAPPAAAREWVAQALRLDPQEPLALTLAGDLAYAAGDLTNAQQQWQAAERSAKAQREVDTPLLAGLQERLASLNAALAATHSALAK